MHYRLIFTHHLTRWDLAKLVWFVLWNKAAYLPKMQKLAEEGRQDCARVEEEEKKEG